MRIGIELTMLEPTEFFFYKDKLKVSSPILMYSLSLATSTWASLTSSVFTSHIMKRYQSFTTPMVTLTILSVIGHCMYFVSRSPATVIIGRLISGLGRSTNMISTGYLNKIYPSEDLAYKKTIVSNFVTFGTIIGPVLTYVFLQIDLNVGPVNLNFGNSAAFYMFICKLLLLLSSFLFMDDIPDQRARERFQYVPRNPRIQSLVCQCPAEEDENENFVQRFDAEEEFLKQNDNQEEHMNEDEEDAGNQDQVIMTSSINMTKQRQRIPIKQALSVVLQNKKVLSVLFTLFLHGMTFKLVNSLIPVEAYRYLNWNIEQIAGMCIANAILGTFVAVAIALCFSSSTHFLNLIGGSLLEIFSLVLLGTLPRYVINMVAANVLFCMMSFFNVVASCLIGLSARMVLEHLTDQKLRRFTDLLRTFVLELSYFFGSLLLPLVDMDLGTSLCVGVFATLTAVVVMVLRLRNIWV